MLIGVIIVGGIAVAVGVALWEHEPFRDWASETWQKTSDVFQEFADGLENGFKERRQEVPFGAFKDFGKRQWQRRRPGFRPRRSDDSHEMDNENRKRQSPHSQEHCKAASSALEIDDFLRTGKQGENIQELRKRGEVKQGHIAESFTAERVEHEDLKSKAGNDTESGSYDNREQSSKAEDFSQQPNFQSQPQHTSPEKHRDSASADFVTPPSYSAAVQDANVTSNPLPHYDFSRRGSAVSSDIDIVSAPGSVHPSSETEDFGDIETLSDSGTETMSHVSSMGRDSDAEGAIDISEAHEGDDVVSVASSWSAVGSVRSEDSVQHQ